VEGSVRGLILSRHLPGGTEKTTKNRVAGIRAEILNRDLQNTKQDFEM
jgi:hypothetical protein